ncbi:MAG: hypothetical protein HYX69_08760 [Planctomycetia bacterium]|nr:hypothetical protein [Planctomycetia bacterium]
MKNVEDIWPLAPLQQLMLAHALADRNSNVLVQQFRCTLAGRLDSAALRRAWEVIVARHALTRTAPVWEGLKKPVQVVRRDVALPWYELDWRGVPEEEQDRRKTALLAKDRLRGFDLAKPPLMRLCLVRATDSQWSLAWTCHHLLLDGWSAGVVLRDVFVAYEQLRRGRTPDLDGCGDFRDYLKWLAAQDRAAAGDFWRSRLTGMEAPAGLPIERPAGARLTDETGNGHCERTLTESENAGLARLAKAQRMSLSTLVEAAWAVLLARYQEREEVVLGVAVSGRPPQVPRVETIVGPLVNNVPRRVPVPLDDPLHRLWRRLQTLQIEAQPFEYCSLEQIGQASGTPGGRLFDSLVVFENYPLHDAGQMQAGDVTIRDIDGTATSNYPLTLVALPGTALKLRMLYDRNRYAAVVAERLLDQLATLLRQMIENPNALVRDMRLAEPIRRGVPSIPDVARTRVLDRAHQDAPVGMPGELWVEDVTESGSKQLRKTGYRARWNEDGSLESMGPSSGSLALGPFRVVPAEITAVLALHPLVDHAAVVGYTDCQGAAQLAAYVVPSKNSVAGIESHEHGLLLGQLRRFLEERLPEPMIPTAWRAVAALPRDAVGRLDASALPEPLCPRPATLPPYIAPRDVLEARVATIWSQVLAVEPVGVTDNFIDLGGYSSLAVTLLARLEQEFGRRPPLASLFEEPTVAHLADVLRRAACKSDDDCLVPIRRGTSQPPLFLIHPAGGTVFCYLELAKHLASDVPLFGLQAQGVDGVLAPLATVESMAAHYIRSMKSIQASGPYRLGGWSTGGVVAFEVARQLVAAEEEVSLVALIDAAIPSADRAFDEGDLAPMIALLFPGEDPRRIEQLRDQPVAEQVEYFRHRAEGVQLLVAGAGADRAKWVFDVFEANLRALVAYRPQPSPAPLVLLRATEHATPMHDDRHLGWLPWAVGGIAVHDVAGSHLNLLQPPAVVRVAGVLDEYLRGDGCDLAAPLPVGGRADSPVAWNGVGR